MARGITNYDAYMQPETGKGRLAVYPEHRADTASASGVIGWGKGVEYNGDQAALFSGGSFRGIALAQQVAEYRVQNVGDSIEGQYEANEAVAILRKGIVWVEVLEAVETGDLAVCDNDTGDFRPADTSTSGVSTPVGEFKTSGESGGLAQLEINLPLSTVTVEGQNGGD